MTKAQHMMAGIFLTLLTCPMARSQDTQFLPETDVLKVARLKSATGHFPLFAAIVLTERNRVDLNWKKGGFTWRYRNKVTLERAFPIHSYHLIPYVAAEPFYISQYRKWSTTDLYVGCLLPVGKHVEFNPYYEFENDTGKAPNRQQYYVGLAVQLYFSLKKASN